MIQLFQQRDFGNKINATFQYIAQNFRSLGLSLLYIVGPVALAAGIATGYVQSNVTRLVNESADGTTNPAFAFQMISFFLSPAMWLSILFSLFANVFVVLTTYSHMKVYASQGHGSIDVADVWAEVQPAIGRSILISILSSIIIGFGAVFFVIPGIYLAVVLSLSLAVTVFENTDFGATWNRCLQLIRDKWWSTFGLIVVMGLIVFVIGLVFAVPSAIITFLTSAKLLPDFSMAWLMLGNVINQVGKILFNAILYTAIGFQYTNLVERQEGRGMISAIDSIGSHPSQSHETDEGTY